MFEVGQQVSLYVTGTGRGGHNAARCTVIKINRKTVDLEENAGSYKPGMIWRCQPDWILQRLTPKGMTPPGYNEGLEKIW